MNLLAFNGSPRKNGNTSLMLKEVIRGAHTAGIATEEIRLADVHLRPCKGCLRCNLIRRCSIRNDDWSVLSAKILNAERLVFASPVYFRHVSAPMKALLDRFRSFVHVGIGEHDLRHTAWQGWKKEFTLLLCMGSPDPSEARCVVELFEFITGMLGKGNRLKVMKGTRLAVAKQIEMSEEMLTGLYNKWGIPEDLAAADYRRNQNLLRECFLNGKGAEHV